jgi:hypothetical protein
LRESVAHQRQGLPVAPEGGERLIPLDPLQTTAAGGTREAKDPLNRKKLKIIDDIGQNVERSAVSPLSCLIPALFLLGHARLRSGHLPDPLPHHDLPSPAPSRPHVQVHQP